MDLNTYTTILYERQSRQAEHEDGVVQLEHFLTDLDKKIIRTRDTSGDNADVFDAVQTMVKKILEVVGTLDPIMKIGKVHPVGSFMEGTKLGRPNEFDFVVEAEFFENTRAISVHDECKNAGAVHLRVSDTESQTILDHAIIQKTREREQTFECENVNYLSPVKFRTHFWQLLRAVTTHLSSQNIAIETKTGSLKLVQDVPQHLDMFQKGPNIEVFMVWTSADNHEKFGISVDVTPALRLLNSIPETAGVNLERLKRYLNATGNGCSDVLLIPTVNLECKQGEITDIDRKLCWRLSFSLLETQIIRSMDSEHKKCLRILKHMKLNQKDGIEQMRELGLNIDADKLSSITIGLQHFGEEMELLTTYRFKMVVLDHAERCVHASKISAKCLLEILCILQQRIYERFLPIYFLPTKNAWSRSPVVLLESSIEKITSLFQDMMKETDYSFDKNFEKFKQVQAYVTERDGV